MGVGWAWQFVVAASGETTAASCSGWSVRPRGRKDLMQSRLHTLSHHPQESNSFTSPKAQGNVAGELDNCQHSGAGIWTAFLPKGLALSCLAGQLLLYAMRKGGMVTDLCTIGQRKFWVTLGKELSFSDFLLPTPQGNGDNS